MFRILFVVFTTLSVGLGTTLPELIGREYWPDFSCVPGWFKVENRDLTHPKAKARGAGILALDLVARTCEQKTNLAANTDLKTIPPATRNCFNLCVLESLTVLERKEEGGPFTLGRQDKLEETMKVILTDRRGKVSASAIAKELFSGISNAELIDKLTQEGQKCEQGEKWGELWSLVDGTIKNQSSETCLKLKGHAKEKTPLSYTGMWDLSCHAGFTDDGIETLAGDGYNIYSLTKECEDWVTRTGVNCLSSCVNNYFFFNYFVKFKEPEGRAHGEVETLEQMTTILSREIFRSEGGAKTAEALAQKITAECSPLFAQVQNKPCHKWGAYFDCLEKQMSCKYEGHFVEKETEADKLAAQFATMGYTPDPQVEDSEYPDMTCKVGLVHTDDHTQGSGLLRKYRAVCQSLLKYTYQGNMKECMLDQMGILVANSSQFDGQKYVTKYKLNDAFGMTHGLAKILPGFGGWDAASYATNNILKYCSKRLKDAAAEVDTKSAPWLKVYDCIEIFIGCGGATIVTNRDIGSLAQ